MDLNQDLLRLDVWDRQEIQHRTLTEATLTATKEVYHHRHHDPAQVPLQERLPVPYLGADQALYHNDLARPNHLNEGRATQDQMQNLLSVFAALLPA